MKKWIIAVVCILYAVLFVYAATSKLLDYQQFVQQLQESPLQKFATTIAWLTPTVELLLAMLLLIPKTRRLALYGSFLLMAGFTCYIIYILKYAPEIPCSCGGILESMNWTQHLLFNIVFVLLALIALVAISIPSPAKYPLRTKILHSSMGVGLLALTAGAISVSATGLNHLNPPKPGDGLPAFTLQLMDSTRFFNTRQIPEGQPVVLTYFLPDCSHCQAELIELTATPEKTKHIRFYYITSGSLKKTRSLYKAMQLQKHPNLTMGIDTARFFSKYFKPKGTPYHAVYNKDKALVHLLPNQQTPEAILSATAPPKP